MGPRDLGHIVTVPMVAVAPDRERIVYERRSPDLLSDEYRSQLWTVDPGGSAPRLLTRGRRDAAPRFSPDGSLLAFLRAEDGPSQLAVLRTDGGEPLILTSQPLGLLSFSWAPDGRSLVYVARVPEEGRYGTAPGVVATAEPARTIDRYRFRRDGIGYVFDRPAQVFVVSVPDLDLPPTPEPLADAGYGLDEILLDPPSTTPVSRQVTDADADHLGAVLSVDGERVLFLASLHEDADLDVVSGVWSVPVHADAEHRPVAATPIIGPEHRLRIAGFAESPDGALWIAGVELGESGRDFPGRSTGVFLLDAAGLRRLTSASDDYNDPALTALDDGSVLAQLRERGETHLVRIDRTGAVARLTDGALNVRANAAGGGMIAVSVADAGTSGDVALVDGQTLRRLTDLSAPLRETGLRPAMPLVAEAPDGHPVHGWVLVPEGGGPHPVLVNIHGGPFFSYEHSLFDEAQIYASAGYAVVMCNPRGSGGYGEEHARAVVGDFAEPGESDILAFLDHAIATVPGLDDDRVGVMGGSYGGYMTAWLIARHHRFTAAIVERAFLDPETFMGTSDIGSWFVEAYTGDDPELRRRQSVLPIAHDVRTPALILHSEGDWNCPKFAPERFHFILKRNGVPTEMLIFPGESHGLSRGGRPRHRMERFDKILAWWDRHLPLH